MRGCSIAKLGWLTRPPTDFRKRVKALNPASLTGDELHKLANHALDASQLQSLAKLHRKSRELGTDHKPLRPLTLGLLSNTTTSFLVDGITASGLRHGLSIQIIETEYGQVAQTAMSPQSMLTEQGAEMVLLALDADGLPLAAEACTQSSKAVENSLEYVDTVRAAIRKNTNAITIVQTLPVPPDSLFGHMDITIGHTRRAATQSFNRGLVERVTGSGDLIFDVAALSESVGTANWFDPVMRHLAKLAFSQDFMPLYADHVCRILAAQRGLTKRVLVLDLDNTLWGGVIGDDGLEGIEIGAGSPVGEAFLEVQRMALRLRNRGIILAVSSKNDDEIARQPFRNHPGMLLKEEHIAMFQINWIDKATNISAIAEALKLGTDSFVFLDDNPAERAQVRRELPEVGVPELPEDPAFYSRAIAASGYFESVTFSEEDKKRPQLYQDNARRDELRRSSTDLHAFLHSLDMVIEFGPFDTVNRARIIQLINKTNQFNLTTRRYTQSDIEQLEADPSNLCLQVRLNDQFGDNGMISVVICRGNGDKSWEIDTWLMSCRVLGRRIEEAVLNEIARLARVNDVLRLVGVYRQTPRNKLVENHYERLGFAPAGPGSCGPDEWRWILDLKIWCAVDNLPMRMQSTT